MLRSVLRAGFVIALFFAIGCKEEGTVRVHSLKFKGVTAVSTSRLANAISIRASSKLPWGRKTFFDRSRFDADLKRIQAFYADRGYPDARVTGFDVKLNNKEDSVDVTLTISEGGPIRVAAIDFRGFDVIPPAHLDALKNQMPLQPGMPRDRQQVVAIHELALNELRDHGYPYARVATNEDLGANGKSSTLTFSAEPGTLAHFGSIQIAGNQSVSDQVVRRGLTFRPGDLYRRSIVQQSQRRLYSLQLFQFANIENLSPQEENPEVATRVTVAEGKHQRVNAGVGYGTEEKARFDGEYRHLNFLGGARSAGAHVRWSSLDRGARVDFNQPFLFRPHLSLAGEGQQWYTYTPAYNSIVSGGKATLTHRGDPRMSFSVSVSTEHDRSTIAPAVLGDLKLRNDLIALGLDPRTGSQNGTLNSVGFDFQRSTADNTLNAHRGYQLIFHAEQAGSILPGTFHYRSAAVDFRHYLPLADRLVWANRLQVGDIAPQGGKDAFVPFAKKYFLGGATSNRGWGVYELSPLSESGLPVGGDRMFAFSSEIRLSGSGNVGGVLFLDAGNVWAVTSRVALSDLRYSVGPGLRYQTPVGPLRVDFGYQLNPIPGLFVNGVPQTRRWRIHFSIGQAF